MSDKSFGDHANKNIVKNPLLSTAVTGLSIEDLTHNAVLLPAAPNQGLTTRSEQQIGSHALTLGHPDNELGNHPSGDSNSNIVPPHYSTTTIPNILDHLTTIHHDRTQENECPTQSKALPKSEDDFDVNEYFARLQGTRYVSAPLNSQIADQNANLAAEENLEEINLNDEKPEVQQSLTADIAQNFSQLPTVLPHVASAVFSSFSSMLSLKSREQTPDEGKHQSYQGYMQAEMPLMSVENVIKEAAPPLKEPPVTGPGNYRMTSKNKYAQIPGLSSGETQSITYNTLSHSIPSYFVPSAHDSSANPTDRIENATLVDGNKVEDKATNDNESFNMYNPNLKENERPDESITENKSTVFTDSFNIYNPVDNVINLDVASNYQPNLLITAEGSPVPEQSNTVIPPPPMFSSQKRDSQTTVKSVLPPSVARRIGSNHPVIKQQTMQSTVLADNIFVPTFDPVPTSDFSSQCFSKTLTAAASPEPNPLFYASQPPMFNPQSVADYSPLYSTSQPPMPTQPPTQSSIPMLPPTIGLQPAISPIGPPKLPPTVPPMFASTIPSNTKIFTQPNVFTSSVAAPSIFTPTETPISSQYSMPSSLPPTSTIFEPQSTPTAPPTFYSPLSVKDELKSELFAPPTEQTKPIIEPPKSTGTSYRMIKKRPQYYSGPIEGVGAISNNTKPIIPTAETGTFQGDLFTPDQDAHPNAPSVIPFDISQTASVPSELIAASMPQPIGFDISKQIHTAPVDINIPQTQNVQSYFDTAFDVSRPTTDYYEEPRDNKGFGIIGSLKSKLSSLDINKIHNTVTTFFDPAYNDSKKDDSSEQETSTITGQGNFEIFVPNLQNAQGYGSFDGQNAYFPDNQYYSNQHNYYRTQEEAYPGYHTELTEGAYTNYPTYTENQQVYSDGSVNDVFETQTECAGVPEKVSGVNFFANTSQQDTKLFDDLATTQKNIEKDTSENPKIEPAHVKIFEEKSAKKIFDKDQPTIGLSAKMTKTEENPLDSITSETIRVQVKEETSFIADSFAPVTFEPPCTVAPILLPSPDPIVTSSDEIKPVNLFTNTKFEAATVTQKLPKADSLLESLSKDEISLVRVASVPLFGLSTVTADESKGLTEISKTFTSLYENKDNMFERNASVSFFENIAPAEPIDDDNVSELNICETCREINKPEDKEDEVDDWTSQLIENITSRIQLSNSVEAPLTEPNTASNDNIRDENDQYDEISHITEETIETIQVQSATELLDNEEEISPRNYGWATEEDHSDVNININEDHDYSFTIDPNTIGFYGNNSLFFDNVPTNASDEIKAEFKHHEDLLPRQMSVPTAPPAEEDTKSDGTGGLDVHSIEQDAKKDFPIYEEFVIEPSETDDDKIEYREREKSDDGQSDTFTNRVERFKKLEDVDSDVHKSMFELSSPPISMASYFDTGNFAVETHYRNSLSSPTQISIPPGFEEEFKKRLLIAKALNDVNVVPETSTQTRTTQVLTFSTANDVAPVGFNIESNITNLVDDNDRLLDYTSFGLKDDIQQFGTSDISARLTSLVDDARFPTAFDSRQETKHFDATSLIGDSTYPKFDLRTTEHTLPDIPSAFTDFDDPAFHSKECIRTDTKGFVASGFGVSNFSSAFGFKDTGLSTGFIASNLAVGSVSTAFDVQEDSLADIPTSLLPADLVEDANFATTFDSAESKLSTHPETTGLVTTDNNNFVIGSGKQFGVQSTKKSKLLEKRYFSTVGDINTSKDDEVEHFSSSIVTANLFGDIQAAFDPRTEHMGLVSKLFEDRNLPHEAKELKHTEAQPSETVPKLFEEGLTTTRVFKPDDTKHIATQPEISTEVSTSSIADDKNEKLPDFSSTFNPKTVPEIPKNDPKLPDAINFFSTDKPTEAPESFSRLASYFSTPPKTDHGKSFFELSQSQNHYRHAPIQTDNDRYLNLMKDLTSTQNIDVKDKIVKQVNYFTVEHDSEVIFNKGDVKGVPKNELAEEDCRESLESVFAKCKYCLKGLNLDKGFQFKKAMDNNNRGTDRYNGTMNENNEDTSKRPSVVNFEGVTIDEANEGVTVITEGRSSPDYAPVKQHWFYRVDVDSKSMWRGFSLADSRALELAYISPELNETTLVATDGGRYDVNVMGRLRIPVYWDDKPTNVRRCSWFYKGTTDARYVPYTELVADKLEEEYRKGMTRGEWHRRLVMPNGEVVVMHGPGVVVHFLHGGAADNFPSAPLFSFGKRVYRNPPKIRVSQDQPPRIDHLILFVHGAGEYRTQKERKESISRPRVVRRGHDESEIEDTEPSSIDHLLLLCHGVGSACDMRFRSVEEVVEDFRGTSLQLLQSHYRNSYDQGVVSRVEVLPISWHASLHSGETGVDRRLAQITLDSIPRLRHFTNDTLLDVLFYTSPVFCQTIIDTVCRELNRVYKLFIDRNPNFKGGVSLGGHSLGSVILYDLLCNQAKGKSSDEARRQPGKTYVSGSTGAFMQYPKLLFSPDSLYALGSPIAIFECIRGVESLGLNFGLPTCKNFFNIFHPYDPIAYRIEPLINPKLRELKPLLIPHHKGRKRMHLELKDTMARVGADLKQKLLESLKTTWNKWKTQPASNGLPNVVEEELEKEPLTDESKEELVQDKELSTPEMLGRLNGGRRIDYVLQEAPLEMINEYIFAMSSHVGYWESEDTMLLMLREIYGSRGVQPDCTVPQQTMTVQRARSGEQDDGIMFSASEYPSTSHSGEP